MNFSVALLEIIFLSIMLIGVALAAVVLMKKGKIGFVGRNNLKEVDRFYFSPKSYVSIMRVGEELLLLGITESNINYLKKIEDKEVIDALLMENSKVKSGTSFTDLLKADNSNFEFLKNRLKQMRQNKNEEI